MSTQILRINLRKIIQKKFQIYIKKINNYQKKIVIYRKNMKNKK